MVWFIVDVYSDVRMEYRVAAETIEADASERGPAPRRRAISQGPDLPVYGGPGANRPPTEEEQMTTHRLLEPISFVSWIVDDAREIRGGALHIRRPRSQKGVVYCGEPVIETRRLPLVRDFTIEHPDVIPLEIRTERDFARLCPECAWSFVNSVAGENRRLCWTGERVTVPITWQEILARAQSRTSRAQLPEEEVYDPRETRAFGDAITAEENAVAEDDSLERRESEDPAHMNDVRFGGTLDETGE